jgi:hypothetical protein
MVMVRSLLMLIAVGCGFVLAAPPVQAVASEPIELFLLPHTVRERCSQSCPCVHDDLYDIITLSRVCAILGYRSVTTVNIQEKVTARVRGFAGWQAATTTALLSLDKYTSSHLF